MRILHIASFQGNIGDIINHEGFYNEILGKGHTIEKLEIRRFYRNADELHFDDEMLTYINTFDALILGGGSFFDVRWEDSQTGTTLDMSKKFVDGIKIPVLVNAMGANYREDKHQAIERFNQFYKDIAGKDNWMITVRNDGSGSRLKRVLDSYSEITVVPDNGFAFNRIQHSSNSDIVGLSITNDLFTKEFNGDITTEDFNKQMSTLCQEILDQGNDIMLFLHTPQDIEVLHSIYKNLGNEKFRKKIRIAPFDLYTVESAHTLNNLYAQCKYVVAMRFHASVVSIKNQVPVIGVAGHGQILGLYEDLGLQEQCIKVEPGFYEKLLSKINQVNEKPKEFAKKQVEVNNSLAEKQREYANSVASFLGIAR